MNVRFNAGVGAMVCDVRREAYHRRTGPVSTCTNCSRG
jgi:hypothetical protein